MFEKSEIRIFLYQLFYVGHKAEFTHPAFACVYRSWLQFFITYLGFAQPTHAETGCVNMP
jgi:hypothetical protein